MGGGRERFTSFCLLPFVDGDKTKRERRRSTGKREIDTRKPRNRFPATFVPKPLISSILSSIAPFGLLMWDQGDDAFSGSFTRV